MSDIAIIRAQQQRNATKALEHLMGLISGMTADGELNEKEILFLDIWLKDHPEATTCWPGDVLAKKVREILSDNVITQVEKDHLLVFLNSLSGQSFAETGSASSEVAGIRTDDDAVVQFEGHVYCFTGEFVYGTRACCERAVISRGGDTAENITRKVDYMVVGSRISPNWVHTSFGRKIQKAMEIKQSGHILNILSEAYWAKHL